MVVISDGSCSEKSPLISVIVAPCAPFNLTVAPTSPWPFSSTTFPLISMPKPSMPTALKAHMRGNAVNQIPAFREELNIALRKIGFDWEITDNGMLIGSSQRGMNISSSQVYLVLIADIYLDIAQSICFN